MQFEDAFSRTTFARDTVSATHADVTMIYDSLSRVLEDSQAFDGNTRSVTSEAFTSYPMTQFAFPNGRQLTNTFDALYRRTEAANTGGSSIAKWQFFGTNRVAECVLGNGLIQTAMNDARTRSARQANLASPTWGDQTSDRLGYDGAGRMITKRYLAGGINGTTHAYNNTSAVVGQTTAFDKGSNKLYERELHAESRSHLYEPFDDQTPLGGYDSLDRLRQYQRGVLSSTGGQGNAGGGSITTPISLPGTDQQRTYDLDGLGNWHRTVFTPVGDSEVDELRQHNSLNQITTINDGGGNVPFSYDKNGNLLNDGIRSYEWDALNRLKRVYKDPSGTPILIGTYEYDALNRRIRKTISNGGLSGSIPDITTDFMYNRAWQCVEERNSSNHPVKQYVWGTYIDELLQQRVDISGTPEDQYPLQDLLYRTTALTDDSGDIVEAYDCDAYGNTLIFDAAGTGGNWWADDASQTDQPTCDFIFTGRRFDMESMIYQYRARYYDAAWGRFLSRDPVVYLPSACGLYGYTSINPIRFLDPSGNYITVHVHVSTAATLDESAEKMRFFEDVRQALQSIVGDCATITLKDKKSVLLGNAGPMPVYAKIGFKYEKPNCKNDECWQELKKAIESDSELPVHWQKKTDRPYWRPQDDVSWIKGFFGTTWGTHINYYDKIPLWEIEPNGKYTARNAPFSVMLWHELIGHGHLGLKHPKTSENVINLDTPTGFYDETIQCENRARRCLGLLERFHQYIQPKERYVPVHGTTWEPE